MLTELLLFAQDAKEAVDGAAKDGNKPGAPGWSSLVPIMAIGLLLYFMVLMPGRKQRQQQTNMLSTLKKNDEVVTHSGILGVVMNIREGSDEITIKSDETKLRILKSAIARIIAAKEVPDPKA